MKVLDRLTDRLAERNSRMESLFVTEGHDAERSLFRRDMAWWVASLGALMGMIWVDGPWQAVFSGFLGGVLGASALRGTRRANAYRRGWIDGRLRMVRKIKESSSMHDWIDGELTYDMVHVMGLGVATPDSPEGLEDD